MKAAQSFGESWRGSRPPRRMNKKLKGQLDIMTGCTKEKLGTLSTRGRSTNYSGLWTVLRALDHRTRPSLEGSPGQLFGGFLGPKFALLHWGQDIIGQPHSMGLRGGPSSAHRGDSCFCVCQPEWGGLGGAVEREVTPIGCTPSVPPHGTSVPPSSGSRDKAGW